MQENLKALKPLEGSKISYFLNGKSLGVAFTDIYRGEYYPAAGLFKQAHIKFNFGPRFKFPPQGAPKFKAMSERVRELEVEQTMSDMRFFSDKEGLKIDSYAF
jgi:Set1/Ash2 histone methyltransferase complex subunit ASH2